ncbi:hypothetical protein BVY01_02650 [bacterium I07]|nr:hypothetical protein BVY01_02650 [bacterium I07]
MNICCIPVYFFVTFNKVLLSEEKIEEKMKQNPAVNFKSTIFPLLLIAYMAVSLLLCFNHNHEIDFSFHDNCPACVWDNQVQNDDSTESEVFKIIEFSIELSFSTFIEIDECNSHHEFNPQLLSRPPPA